MLFAMQRLSQSQIVAGRKSRGQRGQGASVRTLALFHPVFIVCLFAVVILAATSASAQMNTGEISGDGEGPVGRVAAGATVVAEQAGTGLKFTAVADATGEYLLAQLPVGTYTLTAERARLQAGGIAGDRRARRRPAAARVHTGGRRSQRSRSW